MSRRLFIYEEHSYFIEDFKLAIPDLKLQVSILEFLIIILLVALSLKSAHVNKSVCSMTASFKSLIRSKSKFNSIVSTDLLFFMLHLYNKPSLSIIL